MTAADLIEMLEAYDPATIVYTESGVVGDVEEVIALEGDLIDMIDVSEEDEEAGELALVIK